MKPSYLSSLVVLCYVLCCAVLCCAVLCCRFAAETRAQHHKHSRAAATLRLVAPKDLVWVLYSQGCRWLPARVVMVHNYEGHR